MKATRISIICALLIAAAVLAVMTVQSVTTPIKFQDTRAEREMAVKARLVDLRAAMDQYYHVHKQYTNRPDSLILFLQTTPIKFMYKERSLTDMHFETYKLTEDKAVKIIENAKKKALKDAQKKNSKLNFYNEDGTLNDSLLYSYVWTMKEITDNKLDSFRRDTVETNMIDSLYHGRYTAETIVQIKYIPYSQNDTFIFALGSYYSQQGEVALYEVSAPFALYLWDLDKQELANLIDSEARIEAKRRDPQGDRNIKPSDIVPGLKIGDVESPNGGHGNWE